MMTMADTDVLEAEVMTEEDQEVGPLITTIEDLNSPRNRPTGRPRRSRSHSDNDR